MKVLVTGGTGFIGAHTVAALLDRGHDVRLLVRSRGRISPALGPLGVHDIDAVEGDCTDAESVQRAMDGCDSVVHCAAVYNWSPQAQRGLVHANTTTTEIVLGEASKQGLDPIVHVSSYVALDPATPLTPDTAVRPPVDDYAGSKAASEMVARRFADAGNPVVTTYPGLVVGPDDPYLGESNKFLLQLLKPVAPAVGRVPLVDVRDVAAVHARAIVAGRGARRYLATGHDVSVEELTHRAAGAAGVRATPLTLTPGMARAAARAMDAVGRHTPIPVPASRGALRTLIEYPGADPRTTIDELGVAFRPMDETLVDTTAWLRQAGHLRRRAVRPVGASPTLASPEG